MDAYPGIEEINFKLGHHPLCAAFIVFYLPFDVLDFDGSNFPTMRAPVNRTVVIVEVPKLGENVYLPDTTDLWV